MGLILFIFNIIITLNLLATGIINEIYQEVDMIVYLQDDADIFQINTLTEELTAMEEIISVKYTTKDEALTEYLQLYPEQQDPFTIYGIDNPLPASIQIITESPENHAVIQKTLALPEYEDLFLTIESNSENQNLVSRVLSIGTYTNNLVMAVLITFLAASFLVILNAIYLTIFNRRKEIEIMELVGADISFIRWPFLFEGIAISGAAVLLSMILISGFISSVNLDSTLMELTSTKKIITIALLQIIMSIGVGTLSSFIAIENHLKRQR